MSEAFALPAAARVPIPANIAMVMVLISLLRRNCPRRGQEMGDRIRSGCATGFSRKGLHVLGNTMSLRGGNVLHSAMKIGTIRHRALGYCLSMISAQTRSAFCREGKSLH